MDSEYQWALFKQDGFVGSMCAQLHGWEQLSIWFATEGEAEHYESLARNTYKDSNLIILRKRV